MALRDGVLAYRTSYRSLPLWVVQQCQPCSVPSSVPSQCYYAYSVLSWNALPSERNWFLTTFQSPLFGEAIPDLLAWISNTVPSPCLCPVTHTYHIHSTFIMASLVINGMKVHGRKYLVSHCVLLGLEQDCHGRLSKNICGLNVRWSICWWELAQVSNVLLIWQVFIHKT